MNSESCLTRIQMCGHSDTAYRTYLRRRRRLTSEGSVLRSPAPLLWSQGKRRLQVISRRDTELRVISLRDTPNAARIPSGGAGIAALLLLAFPGILPTLPILLLASWMSNVVGIAVTAKAGRRSALRELFGRAVRWRFGIGWYAVALLLPATAVLIAVGIGAILRIDAPPAITDTNVLIPLFVFNVLAGPLGEELGWRGTALPRLLARWSALISSLILGILWWTFHTPGFVLGLFSPGFTPLGALAGAIALTVLITWMFTNTGGSLIPGAFMHLSINFVTAASGVSESPLLYSRKHSRPRAWHELSRRSTVEVNPDQDWQVLLSPCCGPHPAPNLCGPVPQPPPQTWLARLRHPRSASSRPTES